MKQIKQIAFTAALAAALGTLAGIASATPGSSDTAQQAVPPGSRQTVESIYATAARSVTESRDPYSDGSRSVRDNRDPYQDGGN